MGRNVVFGCIQVFIPTIEVGEELVFILVLVFHAYSGTTTNHRDRASNTSY